MIDIIRLATNHYGPPQGGLREVDQIEVHVMDMWLRKDINCERDIFLAQKLAEENGIEVFDYRDGIGVPEPLTESQQEEFAASFDVFAEVGK